MMYDKANELAKVLKESAEYREFLAARDVLATDSEAKKMAKEFIMALGYEAIKGTDEKEGMDKLQQMYEVLSHNAKARDFVDAYTRFQRVMADISKIIGEAVAEGMDIFAKD